MRQLPPITRHLLLLTTLCYLAQIVLERQGVDIVGLFGLHFLLAPGFYPHQLLTYIFLHGSWTHLLLNMFSLWMFGRIIEQTLGGQRFLAYFLVCGIGAGICQELWQVGQYYVMGLNHYEMVNTGSHLIPMAQYLNFWTTIGASGSCYGILLAFGALYPNERIVLLIPPIPMKAKYFVAGYAVIELLSAFSTSSNIAHFAHLGGMLFGWLLLRHWRRLATGSGWGSGRGKSRWTWHKKPLTREEILEKARRKGYGSLTDEEKERLFRP